jgi:hypothetical protein
MTTNVNKVDSNVTSLAYAEEESLGVLPGSPVWKQLEPNSYSDFGGEIKTVAPNPINPNRERRKGVAVDVDASGGFSHNLTYYNLSDLLQGFMFADMRRKAHKSISAVATADDSYTTGGSDIPAGALINAVGFTNSANNGLKLVSSLDTNKIIVSTNLVNETPPATAFVDWVGVQTSAGDIDVVNSGSAYPTLTSTTLDFTTLDLVEGQWIYLGGDTSAMSFSTAANNGFKRIRSIAANTLTLDKSGTTMVTEANTTKTIQIFFGDVLKNEQAGDIVTRSYHLERLLGAPNTAAPTDYQSEVLEGAVPNELTFNVPKAELLTMDMSFVALDNVQYAEGNSLQTSVLDPTPADVFNSTSDIPRMRMTVVSDTDAYPTALFGYLTEAKFMIKNNVTVDKAIGVFGGFDVTVGTFEVSGDLTAYFADVAAVQAVRENENVSIDMAVVKNNRGIIIDLPLVALGDGRLKVEQDQAITLPLKMDAATAKDIDPNLNFTMMFTFFNYLPTVAG